MRDTNLRHTTDDQGDASESNDDGEFIVVSNRQPYRHSTGDSGIDIDRPTGGLTMGLDPVMQRLGGTWVAWGDGDADEVVVDERDHVDVPPETEAYTLSRVWLTETEVDDFYYGFSNQVLWPLCHGMLDTVETESSFWRGYRDVNRKFATAVVDEADDRSTVWFQDYHLGLAPLYARDSLSGQARLGHFWHIPWPEWETFRLCPHRTELLRGLLGNDVIGFHTPRYARNFLKCAETGLEDAHVDWEMQHVRYRGRTTTVEAQPMGVPVDDIAHRAESERASAYAERFRERHDIDDSTSLVLGVDRLDYTKGIPHRLAAVERLLEREPEWRGEVTLVQNASVSRQQIPAYDRVQSRITDDIERLNERFGDDRWTPIVYTTAMLSQTELAGLYREADAAIVSPIRDGLNLVAQEYVAAQGSNPGTLILSETAGIHDFFGRSALTINPFETDAFARTIAEGLTLPAAERRRRLADLRRIASDNDLQAWVEGRLGSLRHPTRPPEAT